MILSRFVSTSGGEYSLLGSFPFFFFFFFFFSFFIFQCVLCMALCAFFNIVFCCGVLVIYEWVGVRCHVGGTYHF